MEGWCSHVYMTISRHSSCSSNVPVCTQLCVPAVAISAVMIAAYKKFILVSLLKYGKVQWKGVANS